MKPSDHGLCHAFGAGVHMKEVFSDNDWAVARKGTRKSGSSLSLFHRGCLLYSASRGQKAISLGQRLNFTQQSQQHVMALWCSFACSSC